MKLKRIVQAMVLLLLLICLMVLPVSAADIVASGACGAQGDNVTWTLDSEGTLTISGEGAMANYGWNTTKPPWYASSEIVHIQIENGVTSIGDMAFYLCTELKSATIPNTVTTIGDDAFHACWNLTDIDLPDSTITIGDRAFDSCGDLSDVTIPDSVTKIGENAFLDCWGLNGIWVSENNMFYSSDNFGVLFDKRKSELIQSPGQISGSYEIPTSVVSVAAQAFFSCDYLTSVTIPDGVNSVARKTFMDCSGLASVTIPDSVTSIGEEAFCCCESLNNLTIPNSITVIGEGAFEACSGLVITFEGDAPSFAESAFYETRATVLFPDDNESWTTKIRQNYGGYLNWFPLSRYSADLTACGDCGERVWWTLDKNGVQTFFGEGLISGDPEGFRDVLYYTAHEIIIEPGVTAIGSYAFSDFSNLMNVTIPNSVTSIEDRAFQNCRKLTTITIPDSVESIGEYAFNSCVNLSSITIGNGVTKIGKKAFYGCNAVTDLTLGSNIQTIGELSLPRCAIWVSENNPNYSSDELGVLFNKDKSKLIQCPVSVSGTYEIPDSVTVIGEMAFWRCKSLTEIKFSDQLTGIGGGAFAGCSSLQTMTIPEGIKSLWSGSHTDYEFDDISVWYVGMFEGCTSLTSVTLPDSLEGIDTGCFAGCIKLVDIKLPDSVTHIAGSDGDPYTGMEACAAFLNCDSLTSITMPKNLKHIEERAFAYCDNLKEIIWTGDMPYVSYCDINDYNETDDEIYPEYAPFAGVTATSYYPAGNTTWDTEKFERFGGNLTWAVYEPVKIIQQPTTAYAKLGEIARTTVVAEGEGLEYTWYVRDIGDTKDFLSSNKTNTYKMKVSQENAGRKAYCVITDQYGNSVRTDTVELHMAATVTTQPKSVTVAEGATAKVTLKAAGDGLTYEWYYKDAGASSFKKTASFTGNSYQVAMTDARNGRQVYCVVTDKYGNTATSDVVTLKMAVPAKITTQPKTSYTKLGATAKATVKAEGDGLTYQWYIKNAGKTKYSKSSVTSATYSCKMSATTQNRRVYCIVTDQYGNSVKTKTVELRMAATITAQPKTSYTKLGEIAKATVTAVGEDLTYQWYVKDVGDTSYSKSSHTTNTCKMQMSTENASRRAYCVIKDKYGNTVKSNTVEMRMAASIATQPKSVTVAKGATAKVTLKAVGDGLKYEWYFKDAGAASFKKTTAFTGNTYSVAMTAARSGRQLYCKVTDKYGNTVKTNTVTLKMK